MKKFHEYVAEKDALNELDLPGNNPVANKNNVQQTLTQLGKTQVAANPMVQQRLKQAKKFTNLAGDATQAMDMATAANKAQTY